MDPEQVDLNQTPSTPPEPDLPTLRTYRGDMAETVREGNVSIAGIALAEQNKRAGQVAVEREVRTSKLFVVLISIFVLAGAAVLAYVFFLRAPTTEEVVTPAETKPKPLIQAESQVSFDVTGKTVGSAYRDLVGRVAANSASARSITDIVTSKGTATLTTPEFFAALGVDIPERIVTFVEKNYMFGIYQGVAPSAFIMLRPTSFGPVFAEMQDYEKDLLRQIYPLLTGKAAPAELVLTWENSVIRNVDVRLGKDGAGKVLMLYSFLPDRSTLIIAGSLEAFNEVLSRAQSPMPITQ